MSFESIGTPVLHDITCGSSRARRSRCLGSTGSGKTTLVNLLPRFYEYTKGSLLLDGVELKEYARDYLYRGEMGIVEQEPFLSRAPCRNVAYGVGHDVPNAEVQPARAAAIHDVILTFPDGYKTLVGEKGVTFSAGQRQRVAIARTCSRTRAS